MKSFTRPSAAILAVIGVLARLLPHPANFTTMGGSVVFSGSKIPRPINYLLPLAVMFITDMFLGFHKTMIFVYGSFILGIFIAEKLLKGKPSYSRIAAVCLANSTIFFVVTNFGVWLVGSLYPRTIAGLVQCFIMAVPFWRGTILGDLVFGVGFIAVYQYFAAKESLLRLDEQVAKTLKL